MIGPAFTAEQQEALYWLQDAVCICVQRGVDIDDLRSEVEHAAEFAEGERVTILGNYTEPAQQATPESGSGESSGGVSE